MRNTIKLACVALAVVGLAGCASNNYKISRGKPAVNVVAASSTTSSINLKTQGNLLVANVTTNWDPTANDSLAIEWTAPTNNFCEDSQFPITKAHQTNDQSWAYRTVVRGNQVCDGVWTAKVVNVNTGKVLASTSYNVTIQAPVTPATPDTAAPAPAAS